MIHMGSCGGCFVCGLVSRLPVGGRHKLAWEDQDCVNRIWSMRVTVMGWLLKRWVVKRL